MAAILLYYGHLMNKYITAAKAYLTDHKKDIKTATPIVLFLVVLIGIVVYATVRNMPNIVYQPVKACDLVTPAMAQDLLGDKVNGVDTKDPVITGETATSKCSYTDLNPQPDQMKVVAVAVRSGINDKGVAQNKKAFEINQKSQNFEVVKDLGNGAYYNRELGQLNFLDDKMWVILNYGVGASPENNDLNKTVELARKILR